MANLRKTTLRSWQKKHDLRESGILTNVSGLLDINKRGVHKFIKRQIKKSDLAKWQANDIASSFMLSEGQEKLLTVLLTEPKYAKPFKFSSDNILSWAKATGLEYKSAFSYFERFSGAKKLVKKTGKRGIYELNRGFVFHVEDLDGLDIASICFLYEFEPDELPEITEEEMNAVISVRRKQQLAKQRNVNSESIGP